VPRSVDEGFTDFLSRLTPTSGESDAAKRHRASIKACLDANFDLNNFFRTGSFGNGTSISGYSDVDYFASIARSDLNQNSGASLTRVRNALHYRFPTSGVRVSCPAVKVPFGSDAKESTEIVPADYIYSTSEAHRVYEIADCSGGWMRSSPDAHNAYVRSVDQKLNNMVKPLIRFVKAWKYYRQVPISSFYLELQIAKYAYGESSIIYSIDVRNIFSRLHANRLAPMKDPKGISGYISPCSTQARLEESKSKLATALSRADKAREAEGKGKIQDAFYWWDQVYAGKFPSYYR
jgi:hypothetical protein